MSEFSNLDLILGLVGTITGIVALFISYWTFKRENPDLKISVANCEHDYAISTSQIKTISFWTDFLFRNIGDRGTSILDIELAFVNARRTRRLKKQYFRDRPANGKRIWISPHRAIDISADFWEAFEGNEEDKIDCTFTIYHTHGAESVKGVSKRRKVGVRET